MRRFRDEEELEESPRANANWLSVLTFWYTLKIFKIGRRRDIDEEDLTLPLKEDQSSLLGTKLADTWSRESQKAELHKRQPRMLTVLYKCFRWQMLKYGLIVAFMELGLRIFQPMFVGLFLRYFGQANRENKNPEGPPRYLERLLYYWTPNLGPITKQEMYVYAAGIMVTSFVPTIILHPYMMGVTHLGMKIRIASSSLIYRKAMRIDVTALGGKTVGNCVNLLANDVNRFDLTPLFFHYIWVSPAQALLSLYFLWREIGKAAFVGMISIAVFIPIQAILALKTIKYRSLTAIRSDERIRLTNEFIQGMQVIKMYAWEGPLADLIDNVRREEMKVLRATSFIRGLFMSMILFTTRLGIFLSCMSYVLFGNRLTAETVFFVVGYYFVLRQTMTVYFPQGVAQVAEALVAVNRIEAFMHAKEATVGDPHVLDPKGRRKKGKRNVTRQDLSFYNKNVIRKGIFLRGITVKYGAVTCINNLDLEVVPGEMTAVIGPVGSGKSCILNTILGELTPVSGTMTVNGVVSFASQEPWLFAGTVRDNILFGEPFEKTRYREAVTVCALGRDLTLLPYGDRTIVGERGLSLSGGQRARVNLARAVYKRADIYLLDDPLSAVDAAVGKQIFDTCITGYLKDKAVILVTHQLQFLQNVRNIIVMDEGNVIGRGSYSDLLNQDVSYVKILKHLPTIEEDVSPAKPYQTILSLTSTTAISRANFQEEIKEIRTKGVLGGYVYKQYFRAGGPWILIIFVACMFLGAQIMASSADFFAAKWSQLEEKRAIYGTAESLGFWNRFNRQQCIIIFSVFITMTAVIAISRSIIFYMTCVQASINLHNQMFHSIVRASMRFFHNNPSGRILNRFSKDMGAVDEILPAALIDTTQITLNLVGCVFVSIYCDYYLSIPICVMCICFYMLRRYYLSTSRSVKRLDGITRSPVFTHLNATLQGLITIRSEGKEIILVQEFDKLQDIHSSAFFLFLCTSRAFGYWLDMLSCVFISVVTVIFAFSDPIESGPFAGLAITQAVGLIGVFQWGMRQSAELESQMTSVERILEFIHSVEHEPPLESEPNKKPPADWPTQGRIRYQNFSLKYDPMGATVLQNIGIVGRTGAGKSTLISSLFRLAYAEGQLIIDKIDVGQIGLHDLRKKISIIPQEPVLFSGTLKHNLDPFEEYRDAVLTSALIDVEIKVAITEGEGCLQLVITEGGSNLSIGQRQLICLARAIVRNNKILVMDEATANVDPQTDYFIQKTIRVKFAHCTVLTIAHRLATVIDSDRIMVLDAGRVVEFDHPEILLRKKGLFFQMVEKTGKAMSDKLKQSAKENYDSRMKRKRGTEASKSSKQ